MKKNSNDFFRKLSQVDIRLKEVQVLLVIDPFSVALQNLLKIFLNKRIKLLDYNTTYLKQKSKTNYLIFGDTKSKYYQCPCYN